MATNLIRALLLCAVAGSVAAILSGCSEKKMTQEWCEEMMLKPNDQWEEKEYKLFARDCLEY